MCGELLLPAEGLPAFAALVRIVSRVDSLVDDELRLHVEGFPTVAALIGFLPCVHSDVNQEVGLTPEGFPTLAAFMGLHPRVRPLVYDEWRLQTEGFPTLATLAQIPKSRIPTCPESVSGSSFQNGNASSLTGLQVIEISYSILRRCQKTS